MYRSSEQLNIVFQTPVFRGRVRMKILVFPSTKDKYKTIISEKDQKVLKRSLTRKYPIIMQNYPI